MPASMARAVFGSCRCFSLKWLTTNFLTPRERIEHFSSCRERDRPMLVVSRLFRSVLSSVFRFRGWRKEGVRGRELFTNASMCLACPPLKCALYFSTSYFRYRAFYFASSPLCASSRFLSCFVSPRSSSKNAKMAFVKIRHRETQCYVYRSYSLLYACVLSINIGCLIDN